MAEEILNQIEGKIKCIKADGAYGEEVARKPISEIGVTTPLPRTADTRWMGVKEIKRYWK